uniref:IDP808 n=1 Tax=Arundo donax TaxID=35708 RepID=A0A0A9AWN2_ARUDO
MQKTLFKCLDCWVLFSHANVLLIHGLFRKLTLLLPLSEEEPLRKPSDPIGAEAAEAT